MDADARGILCIVRVPPRFWRPVKVEKSNEFIAFWRWTGIDGSLDAEVVGIQSGKWMLMPVTYFVFWSGPRPPETFFTPGIRKNIRG